MPPITLLCNTTGNNSFTRGISITFGTLVKCDQQHRKYAYAYQLACDNVLQILMHSSQQLYDNIINAGNYELTLFEVLVPPTHNTPMSKLHKGNTQ